MIDGYIKGLSSHVKFKTVNRTKVLNTPKSLVCRKFNLGHGLVCSDKFLGTIAKRLGI